MRAKPQGPQDAEVMLILPYPTQNAATQQLPIEGNLSKLLADMLHEAGFLKSDLYITTAYKLPCPGGEDKNLFATWMPKKEDFFPSKALHECLKELEKEIATVRPKLIITMGNLPLWALQGEMSCAKWRGSQLTYKGIRHLPTHSPVEILRQWSWRFYTIHDLKRARRWLEGECQPHDRLYHICPTFQQAYDFLTSIRASAAKGVTWVSHDIETVAQHIDCVALTTDGREAMCIPLMSTGNKSGYWSAEEETHIIRLHREILIHPNVRIIGQNYAYDAQYIARYWGFLPYPSFDTQIAWHVLYPGERKSLDVLASLLCQHYVYWKDDLKDHRAHPEDETKLWTYNCDDVCNTFEVKENEHSLLTAANLWVQFEERMAHARNVLHAMLRGVCVDHKYRGELHMHLMELQCEYEKDFEYILPHEGKGSPWYRSPTRLRKVLYDEMKLPVQRHKKTKKPTADDKALEVLASKEPILRPIIQRLQEYRSIGVFVSTFIDMQCDHDGRARSSLNMAGPETFRLASSKDVFGYGLNLQNIPKGTEK
jgi:uracil-DNA glycosylase family 4